MATEAIRRIRQVFSVEGADAVVAANERVARSQQGIASSATTSERATLSLERQFGSIERRYNATVRAQQDYERVQRQVNAAVAQNPALTERGNAVLALAEKQYRRATAANENFTKSQGLARYELINLSRQLQDVGVSLASGQSPFTVLVQQGTQIGDIFANSTGTFRGFLGQLRAMISPTLLLGAGIVALGAGVYAAFSSWKNFALTLDDAARSAGIATREMAALQAAASFKGIGQDDFAAGMKQFASAVYEARTGSGELAKFLRANRQTVGDTATTFERVGDLIMRARDDQQRLQLLQQAGLPATMEWVRLMSQGAEGIRQAKEQAVVFGGAANDEMIKKAREFDEAWNRAWTNFGLQARNAVVSAASALVQLGREIRKSVLVPVFGASDIGREMLKRGQGTPLSTNINDLYGGLFGGASAPKTGGKTVDPNEVQRALALEQQRIGLLGELATVQEQVRAKEIEIQLARLNGVNITRKEERAILELTRAMTAQGRLEGDTRFEAETALLSNIDQQIASRLRQVYRGEWRSHMNDAIADQMRFNDVMRQTSSLLENNIASGLADVTTGTKSFKDAFADTSKVVLRAIEEMAIKMYILRPLMSGLSGLLGGGGSFSLSGLFGNLFGGSSGTGLSLFGTGGLYATGAAFDAGRVIPFADGGVIDRPILFPMTNGMGLAGEAGPEAVIPLRRGRDGRLGVAAHGAPSQERTVTVHAPVTVIAPEPAKFNQSRGQISRTVSQAWQRAQRFN